MTPKFPTFFLNQRKNSAGISTPLAALKGMALVGGNNSNNINDDINNKNDNDVNNNINGNNNHNNDNDNKLKKRKGKMMKKTIFFSQISFNNA